MTTSTLPRWANDAELGIVSDLARCLACSTDNYNVSILAPHCSGAQQFETLHKVKIYRYKYFFTAWEKLHYDGGIMAKVKKNKFYSLLLPFSLFFQLAALAKLTREKNIDIIHAHWIIPQGLVAVLYKKLFNNKIRIVCTAHGTDIFGLNGSFFSRLKNFVLNHADAITAVSPALKKEMEKSDGRKNRVFLSPNAVDTDVFSPAPPLPGWKEKYALTSFCLLAVGRLDEKKGFVFLLNALPEIVAAYPAAKLLIIGDGPEREHLQEIVFRLKLGNNVIMAGRVPHEELPHYYRLADIFLCPSLAEGFGLVLIEALACGITVVATPAGGLADIIRDRENGILVPPHDPGAIAAAVLALLKDPGQRQRLSRAGRFYAKNYFNWEKTCSLYRAIYAQTLNGIAS
ncbi:MAG: glycosyltransferase [Planctomycetes bacterium]|jgi:N-acetyl-alpha-D-glucosaminyl L-malate synthase BshA|nr:glycosyltransferase [Planctomycetota bacterium]